MAAFGGAATCIGGAIRDPLSGRSYVYQAMRVTGAGDPLKPVSETLPGKLPQRKLVTTAAAGYSSYGNQIGLATGQVDEIYHPGYVAKRINMLEMHEFNHQVKVERGVLKEECSEMLSAFFRRLRVVKKKKKEERKRAEEGKE